MSLTIIQLFSSSPFRNPVHVSSLAHFEQVLVLCSCTALNAISRLSSVEYRRRRIRASKERYTIFEKWRRPPRNCHHFAALPSPFEWLVHCLLICWSVDLAIICPSVYQCVLLVAICASVYLLVYLVGPLTVPLSGWLERRECSISGPVCLATAEARLTLHGIQIRQIRIIFTKFQVNIPLPLSLSLRYIERSYGIRLPNSLLKAKGYSGAQLTRPHRDECIRINVRGF